MEYCNIKAFYRSTRSNYNIVSSVLFNMKNGYKNFNKYLYGIENWLKFIDNNLQNYYLRVYIDNSIIKNKEYFNKIKEIIKKDKKLQIVYFNCPDFKNDQYHKDLFSTLIRFLPLFDYAKNDTNYVLIRDLDVSKYNVNVKPLFSNYINKFSKVKHKSGVIINLIGYEPEHFKNLKTGWGFNATAAAINTNIKLPISILNNYLQKLHNSQKMGYGVDEHFLNSVLLDHYLKFRDRIAVIRPSFSVYYIQNSLSKSLHYSGHEKESKEVMKCKTIDQLRQFIEKHSNIVKEKYLKQVNNYNPNMILTNYYI